MQIERVGEVEFDETLLILFSVVHIQNISGMIDIFLRYLFPYKCGDPARTKTERKYDNIAKRYPKRDNH